MNTKKYISIVFFLYLMIFSNNKSFGQNPDTSNYFPHHLGDVWEYVKIDWLAGTIDTLQYHIVKDSVDLAGNSYVTKKGYHIKPFYATGQLYFIIDTIGNIHSSYNAFIDSFLVLKIEATMGQYWIAWADTNSYIIGKLVEESQQFLFGESRTVKEISYFSASDTSDPSLWLNMYNEKYADGLGLIWSGGGDTFSDMNMIGAVIDSMLYGDTTYVTNITNPHQTIILNQLQLNQNYPNPFNIQTNISFALKKANYISLIIYNLLGQEVDRLIDNRFYHSGNYDFAWEGRDSHGRVVGSGVYLYTLNAGAFKKCAKMILIK